MKSNSPINATCNLDDTKADYFDPLVLECQKAGGVIYVIDYRDVCIKGGYSIDLSRKNAPFCILFEEESCQRLFNSTNDWPLTGPLYDVLVADGYTCEYMESDFHPLDNIEPMPPTETIEPTTSPPTNKTTISLFQSTTIHANYHWCISCIQFRLARSIFSAIPASISLSLSSVSSILTVGAFSHPVPKTLVIVSWRS
jgi:hypothetical protein